MNYSHLDCECKKYIISVQAWWSVDDRGDVLLAGLRINIRSYCLLALRYQRTTHFYHYRKKSENLSFILTWNHRDILRIFLGWMQNLYDIFNTSFVNHLHCDPLVNFKLNSWTKIESLFCYEKCFSKKNRYCYIQGPNLEGTKRYSFTCHLKQRGEGHVTRRPCKCAKSSYKWKESTCYEKWNNYLIRWVIIVILKQVWVCRFHYLEVKFITPSLNKKDLYEE